MYQLIRCDFESIEEKVCSYYEQQDILVDSFWEDHACESTYYQIMYLDQEIGYCGIYKKELMTLFHIYREYTYLAQDIFVQAKRLESVNEVFVPTGDELLLSLCMDSFREIEKQAYFTRYKQEAIPYNRQVVLTVATESDEDRIKECSKDYFDNIKLLIAHKQIYIATKDEMVVGFGVVEQGRIRRDLVSIGMYVRETFRQQGIGKTILLGLKELVENEGKQAISGCWYYNHNSLKTQLSVGNDCTTRLLRIKI